MGLGFPGWTRFAALVLCGLALCGCSSVKEFFKRLNDLKSRKHPAYSRYHDPLSRGEKVEWTSSDDITIVMVETGPGSLFIVTAYKEGVPDPVAKPGECGSPDVELPPPSRA